MYTFQIHIYMHLDLKSSLVSFQPLDELKTLVIQTFGNFFFFFGTVDLVVTVKPFVSLITLLSHFFRLCGCFY